MTKPVKRKTTTATEEVERKLLTETELELIQILWKLGEGTVSQVLESLQADRNLAYTSVSTILRILEQKKILKSRKEGRGHVYIPLISKEDYGQRTLRHVVDRVFEGAPLSLAKQLIQGTDLTGEDIKELKKMIEQVEKKI